MKPADPAAVAAVRSGNRRAAKTLKPAHLPVGAAAEGDGTMSGNKPTAEVRLGRIKAAIWANENRNGERWHTVQLTRLYQDGDQWRSTHSFGRNDLLTVAKVADLAHTKVCNLEAAERDREEAPAEEAEPQ